MGVKIFLFLCIETSSLICDASNKDAGRKLAFYPPEGRITIDTSLDSPARAEHCRLIGKAAGR